MNKRESNFELLRIFAMFLIIWHHLSQHGIYLSPDAPVVFNTIIGKAFFGWTGNLGNYLFILCSGYFVSKSQFSWIKVFKLWFQIFFTSVFIGIILYLFRIPMIRANVDLLGFYKDSETIGVFNTCFTLKNLFKSFLPTLYGNNWFASAYLLFYMFTPFLNESLKVLDEFKHRNLILLMIVVGTLIYMVPGQGIFQTNNLFYFILCYYIGNYIRLYNPKIFFNQKLNISLSLLISTFFVLWIIILLKFRYLNSFVETNFIQIFLYPMALSRFPILLDAILVFSIFKNLKIPYNSYINMFASTTFGVYLVHENPFFNGILWHRIFKIDMFLYSKYLLLYMFFVVICTFFCCSVLDLIRQRIIEKPVLRIVERINSVNKK